MIGFRKALSKLILVGLFIVPFIPLFVANSLFFPYITGKAFLFRILIEILFGLWLILLLLDRAAQPTRSSLLYAALGLVAVAALATIFGADPYHSFWSNFERMDGLISLLHLSAYFLLLVANLRSEKIWHLWWQVNLAAGVLVVFLAIGEYGRIAPGASARLATTFGNPIYLAVYSLFQLFIAAWLWSRTRLTWQRWLYVLVIVAQLWMLLNTGTRSAILGLGFGILVSLALAAWRAKAYPRTRRLALGLILLLVIGGGIFWSLRDSEFVTSRPLLSRISHISLADATTRHRLLNWRIALEGFKERPLLGWGPENYVQVFSKHFDPRLYDAEPWFDRTHNIFLDWLVNAGILGLLNYLWLYVVALYYLWRPRKIFTLAEQIMFTGLLAAYLVHNIFVFDNLTSYLLFFAFLAFLHLRVTAENSQAKPPPLSFSAWRLLPVALIILAVGSGLYYFNLRPWQTNRVLITALMTPEPEARLAKFKEAASHGTFGATEVGEQLITDSLRMIHSGDLSAEVRQLALATTEEILPGQIAAAPNNIRLLLFYGSFLRIVGQAEAALPYLERAYELAPRKHSVLMELSQVYLILNQNERAIELAKTAYELSPEYIEAKRWYAQVLGQTGRVKEAQRLLEELDQQVPSQLTTREITDSEINGYVAAGDFERVLELWQARIAQQPENIQFRFSLAAAYLKVGEREKSIAELEAAKKIDPEVAAQADKIIADITNGKI